MKFKILIPVVLLSCLGFSQPSLEVSDLPNSVQAFSTMPQDPEPFEIIPASPVAQSLGQYGGINVGLASGTINKQILLYDFRGKHLNVPISVNYSSNGVKINDNGGLVGTSWTVSMGGVITRTVMGEIDELATRLGGDFQPGGGDIQTLNYLKGMISYGNGRAVYDGQPDLYSFHFNGYSGKFILDANGTPVLLNHNGLSIKRNDLNSFTITTPDGTRYDFGGSGAIETLRSGGGFGCRVVTNPYSSAFYLKKIVHPLGESIDFIYRSATVYTYPTSVQETFRYTWDTECTRGAPVTTRKECMSTMTADAVLLEEIRSASAKIVFSYKSHLAGNYQLLKGFKVYESGTTTPFREVELTYVSHQAASGYRMNSTLSAFESSLKYWNFLTGIREIGADGNVDRGYTFSYLDLHKLPSRFANCQDHFGYFNGKNNFTMVPPPEALEWRAHFPSATANREPDAAFVCTGMLSRIVYPTGGMDSMVYEPNMTYGEVRIPSPVIHGSVAVSGEAPYQEGIAVSEPFTPAVSTTMDYYFQCHVVAEDGPYPGNGIAQILVNGVVKQTFSVQVSKYISGTISLEAGSTYQVRVRAIRGPQIRCAFSYSYVSEPPTIRYQDIIAPGVRITKFVSNSGTTRQQKIYRYYALDDPDQKSSGHYVFSPTYSWLSTSRFRCFGDENGAECLPAGISATVTASSNARFGSFYFSSAPVYYRDVYEEDGHGGGVSYKFIVQPNSAPHILRGEGMPASPTVHDDINGLEVSRCYFKRSGMKTVVPIKAIFTNFRVDPRMNRIHAAYSAQERYIVGCSSNPPMDIEFEPFDLMLYNHHQRWIYADTVRTRNYSMDGSTYNETTEIFHYDNPGHAQLSRKVSSDSNGNQTVAHTLFPMDYANGTPFIDGLKINGLIGLPIERVIYRKVGTSQKIIGGSTTVYKEGGKGLVDYISNLEALDAIVATQFKFSNRAMNVLPPTGAATPYLSDVRYRQRAQFLSYDQYNNPREMLKQDNITKTYLWGYNGQYPIAKIENASYEEVKQALSDPSGTFLNQLSSKAEPSAADLTRLNNLRNHAGMGKAQITTYTYKPLVGMTSMTDPRGITEYYQYDGFQRLKDVLDFDKNVLENYRYHYRP